ncbi:MAG TPA: glyoxylate/hydroxypyruvate reductase A, partial [Alphaproteobacteria bacterium]|nr:glyoxylate/hydroxypyruvate reductase A [Alphaproteobacteria bacterium]
LLHVLDFHRQMPAYRAQQKEHLWRALPQPRAAERTVGIMGLGQLGSDLAGKLAALEFHIAGWSRAPKALPEVDNFAGPAGLAPFLARSEIVVCLLPLTPETRGILSRETFARLPRGAALINLARGAHLIEDDLLAALDAGQLSGAALDVFAQEPLDPGHPFWSHPKITVTPHVATVATPETSAPEVAENLKRAAEARPLIHTVDRARGY